MGVIEFRMTGCKRWRQAASRTVSRLFPVQAVDRHSHPIRSEASVGQKCIRQGVGCLPPKSPEVQE